MKVGDATVSKFDAVISVITWLEWLGLAVVLVLVCVLVFLIWKRKYAKNDSKLILSEITVPPQLLLPANALLKVWRNFVGAIPWRLRSSALSTPFSLVIGDAGSGKTGIIDQYADWQGQDFSFHPSSTDDPLLQIYLGAKALVLEFSSALIYDTTTSAYHALKKLWKHLPPSPQVVMVIDVSTLQDPQADRLRQTGQALFGKLKAFGELEGQPLPLILALSQMDKVQGFKEFCTFLKVAGIPLQLEFPDGDGINRFESCLEGFQQHLPRALVNCPAQDYLKIVAFLAEAPGLFGVLIDFLRVLGLEQGVASPPVIRLCLLSEQFNSFGCHPFALPPCIEKPSFTLNYHARAALSLALVGSAYLIATYIYQQNLQTELYKTIQSISKTPVEYYAEKISPSFGDAFIHLNPEDLLVWRPLQPTYFPAVDKYNRYLLIINLRKYYLIPLLKNVQFEQDAMFKTTRFLAVLYATSSNEMGKLIRSHWEKNRFDMNKYGRLIDDYIRYNTALNELDNTLNSINFTKGEADEQNYTPWLVLFHTFQEILKKPFITQADFNTLQQQITPFFQVINDFNFYSDNPEVMQWLMDHTDLHVGWNQDIAKESELRQKSIAQLLTFVNSLEYNEAENCPVNLSLTNCFSIVQAVANAKPEINDTEMVFNLDGEHFAFTPDQWLGLIKRSRITMILRNFIETRNNRRYGGWIFFDSPSEYDDVVMNASNNGQMPFTGQARIDGRLTADAFDMDVKPSILALSDVVEKLPIDQYEKKHFSTFVLKNLSLYTDRYVQDYLHYFSQFKIAINSAWELNYVLDDLQEPDSLLLETLVQIKDNTTLKLSDSTNFSSFAQKLTVFRFVQRLMEEKEGVYPEFQKYQMMMATMQDTLDSTDSYVPKKSDGDAALLKGALTPIGRVAWAMLLNEDDSYLTILKSWLQNVGIQADWQQPFLAPVKKVKQFGTAEINQNINGIWSDIWSSNVTPLMNQFPFSVEAGPDKELSINDLNKTFHPKQGAFWVTFQQYLSPLSSFNNGVWSIREALTDSLVLPTNYLKRLNAVQQLTTHLWDEQGTPKPLQLSVKPGLLPTFDSKQIPHAPLVSLTYLRQGGISVLGFNQQPTWQQFSLEWWQPQEAEVGMEFRKDEDPTRVYTEVTMDNSTWNFFRLLQKGQYANTLSYRWPLAHPDFPQQPLNLEFYFKTNPLAVFANLAGS